MQTLTYLLFTLFTVAVANAERVSLVGATVINPADGKVMPNATIVINGDKIERVAMGRQDAATLGNFARLHRHTRSLLSIG